MSAVLRKMIEAGSGMPPSISEAEPFWDTLKDTTRAWFVKILGADINPVIAHRKSASGAQIQANIGDQILFAFGREASPGICAFCVDQRFAVEVAAARMGESADALLEASNVLMRLLLEDPMASLWMDLSRAITPDFVCGDEAPFADGSVSGGAFAPDSQYIETQLTCELNGKPASVTFVFALDFVKARAGDSSRGGAMLRAAGQYPDALRRSIRSSSIHLDAVIDHLELTIADCARLKPGDVLELPAADTQKLALSAGTIDGPVNIGEGSLGTWRDYRAVKLQVPVSKAFLQEIAEL